LRKFYGTKIIDWWKKAKRKGEKVSGAKGPFECLRRLMGYARFNGWRRLMAKAVSETQ